MATSNTLDQATNIVPPRAGNIIALGVDATSRGYAIQSLQWGGQTVQQRPNQFYVTLLNDGSNDIFFAFDSAAPGTNEIADTSITSAGGTIAFDALTSSICQCGKIPAGVWMDVRIDRMVDQTLIVKCASGKTSTLRMWPSSQLMPGATA